MVDTMKLRQMDVQKPRTWPPGALMQFSIEEFTGLGVVVGNTGGAVGARITVLWDSECKTPLRTYRCDSLNPRTVTRVM